MLCTPAPQVGASPPPPRARPPPKSLPPSSTGMLLGVGRQGTLQGTLQCTPLPPSYLPLTHTPPLTLQGEDRIASAELQVTARSGEYCDASSVAPPITSAALPATACVTSAAAPANAPVTSTAAPTTTPLTSTAAPTAAPLTSTAAPLTSTAAAPAAATPSAVALAAATPLLADDASSGESGWDDLLAGRLSVARHPHVFHLSNLRMCG